MSKPSIGIIREGKIPPDARVAFTPEQCSHLMSEGWTISVQSSPHRCYPDADYIKAGVPVVEDVSNADVLIGIKEVPIEQLIPNKTYFFFSHTIKKQVHNRGLLQAMIEKNIAMIDYEVLTDENHERLIAFGHFAGVVGAHNGLYTYGQRTGLFHLPRMNSFPHYEDAREYYSTVQWPPIKIVLTGKGRVGMGAAQVLDDMGFQSVAPSDFLSKEYSTAVYTQLDVLDYVKKKSGGEFQKKEYYTHPELFEMDFMKYLAVADIFINGIFWDKKSLAFFTLSDIQRTDFFTKVIADITCDIAPDSSVPTTIKASTIEDPVFGFSRKTLQECKPYTEESIDIMSIDNLPNELPRDASNSFGEKFISVILPELMDEDSAVIRRATMTKQGSLTEEFSYLSDFVMHDIAQNI